MTKKKITKEEIIALEGKIITKEQFDLIYTSKIVKDISNIENFNTKMQDYEIICIKLSKKVNVFVYVENWYFKEYI